MGDDTLRPVLTGQKALVVGVANDQSIAYGCAKAFRTVGAELAITWLNQSRDASSSHWTRTHPPITGALDVSVPANWKTCSTRSALSGESSTFSCIPLLSLPRGLAGRPPELLGEGFREGDGCLLPLVRANGGAGGAIDDRRRDDVRHELLRRQSRGGELQRDGAGESGTEGVVSLSGV